MQNNKNKPDIEVGEIKDILEQLQNLSISENSVQSLPKKDLHSDDQGNFKKNKEKRLQFLYISASVFIFLISVVGGYFAFVYSSKTVTQVAKSEKKSEAKQERVKPATPLQVQAPNPIVVEARKLIQGGKIISARKLLLDEVNKGGYLADVPLLLAQSYDPNYLKTLATFDAEAELNEARRWYQDWFRVASNSESPPSREKLRVLLEKLR